MNARSSIVLGMALLAILPSASAQDPGKPAPRPQLPPLGKPAGVFGQAVSIPAPVPLEAVAADPMKFHARPIRVDAVIADVCRKKGCWMVLRDGEREMTVRFQGYSFFVPRDAHGRRVIAQGMIKVEEISEAQARHYAEESGHPERAPQIVGPQKVLTMMATGVEVLSRDEPPLAAQGAPEAQAALREKLGKAEKVGTGAKPADAAAAWALLKTLPGARTAELGLQAELDGWFAFGVEGEAPFARGWAVKKDTGDVVRF